VFSSSPFQLNNETLEPGCFTRGGPLDVYTHIDLTFPADDEAHITVGDESPYSVDQVLVAGQSGYRVYNTFETGTVDNDADVDPNQTATDLFAPDAGAIDRSDVVLCVSDHAAPQNEPYQEEGDGLVSAKNRPIIKPQVTALGVSAIEPLNTYKLGFGYSVERWYQAPSFDGALAFPSVTDPNALPTPTAFGTLPDSIVLSPREDGAYDARRVNDVDISAEDWIDIDEADSGQDRRFKRDGDLTAWTDSNGPGLITLRTEGDLPASWTLRPSLASAASERSVTFSHADLDAWHDEWQAYYAGKGPRPELALPPGTNSPRPQQVIIVNPPETSGPVTPTPHAPAGQQQAVVQQVPVAPAAAGKCVSNKTVKLRFGKKVRSARVTYAGGKASVARKGGKLVATLDFSGIEAQRGADLTVVKITKRVKKGKKTVKVKNSRVYNLCG
jgi:hypothetical protein